MKHNKNLGENRKESQLPIKSRGCNEIQGFRGNCDSKGKLGMCPSLAESDSGGIPRRELLLEKPVFPVRQKGVPPLLLPTSMLQLPRCLVRTYNLDSYYSTLLELESFKKCNCSRKNRLQNSICFANVGYSPTPRQHFCKTAAPKNFSVACGSNPTANLYFYLMRYDYSTRRKDSQAEEKRLAFLQALWYDFDRNACTKE